MRLFWVCLVAVVLVVILYVAVHRILINRATIMLRNRAQKTTDEAVNTALTKLLQWDRQLFSQLVADVWGKGVLAFEYHFDYRSLQKAGQELNQDAVKEQLATYAKEQQLKPVDSTKPVFVVTDWWTYEGVLHIDVAYLLNEATVEYVADLKKLSHHNN